MANRKARRAKKRRASRVQRTERVKPPPEARQHQRTWPMQQLLRAGKDGGGIEVDEFEAALQIVDAFKALTRDLAVRSGNVEVERISGYMGEAMSDGDARRIVLWFAWVERLPVHIDPAGLVSQIEDGRAISSVADLRIACHLWDSAARDQRKIERAEQTAA